MSVVLTVHYGIQAAIHTWMWMWNQSSDIILEQNKTKVRDSLYSFWSWISITLSLHYPLGFYLYASSHYTRTRPFLVLRCKRYSYWSIYIYLWDEKNNTYHLIFRPFAFQTLLSQFHQEFQMRSKKNCTFLVSLFVQ